MWGSEGFVREVQDLVDRRRREISESAGAWALREVAVRIGPTWIESLEPENRG
jgi:hypothetical protein